MADDLRFDSHNLNVDEVKAALADADDLSDSELLELIEHEKAHPAFEGGREGVLGRLEERLGEAEAAEAAEAPLEVIYHDGAQRHEGVLVERCDAALIRLRDGIGTMVLAREVGRDEALSEMPSFVVREE